MKIARGLPWRLVQAIPTLRLLRILFQRYPAAGEPWTETDMDAGEDDDATVRIYRWYTAPWDRLNKDSINWHQRWWRVDEIGKLTSLSPMEVKCAMQKTEVLW